MKNRRIHHARSLVIKSVEQLREVPRAGASAPMRLASSIRTRQPLLACTQPIKGGSAGLMPNRLTPR